MITADALTWLSVIFAFAAALFWLSSSAVVVPVGWSDGENFAKKHKKQSLLSAAAATLQGWWYLVGR